MHRYMKDVVLSKNSEELELASSLVIKHEKLVLNNFRVIREQFLGDKDKAHELYEKFVGWREIRNEVISLIKTEKEVKYSIAADITKKKGAVYVAMLSETVQEFVDFAESKAAGFQKNSQTNANRSVAIMSSLIALTITLSILIAFYTIRKQRAFEKEINKRNHIIDQNIMMAELDAEGSIVSITNALCRHFESLRSDLVNKPSHFFLSADDVGAQEESIWKMIKSGTNWEGETKHLSRNHTIKWTKLTILPKLNSEYLITGYSCICQDLTSKKASLTDTLTMLGNRRQFDEIFSHEIKSAGRHNDTLVLAIIDVDFFKKYNDSYGHPAGDEVLSQVGKTILSYMRRPKDCAFRIGGEEFAILLSDINKDDAFQFLENIRIAIEKLEISHVHNSISEFLTISIGAAIKKPDDNLDQEHLYIEADKALYLAKESRNKTVLA